MQKKAIMKIKKKNKIKKKSPDTCVYTENFCRNVSGKQVTKIHKLLLKTTSVKNNSKSI